MLTIDGINYDNYVVHKKYNVQQVDEANGYLDGWSVTHRMISRTRVSGKIVLAFPPLQASRFINAMKNNEGIEGEHTITLLVQNLCAEKTITGFIYTSGKTAVSTPAFGSNIAYVNITLNVEER